MADLTAFSSNTFNSSAWINASLGARDESTDLEAYISSLSTKLHIMSQDYTDQLETAMVESMSTMPRILSEISKTEDQLRAVEGEMNTLSAQLQQLDQRNVTGVEDLSRLDTLKANMEKCKATLEEHARWSQLVREAMNLLEGGGRLSDSADRIETMFKSLAVLRALPGNDEREATCETFKSSLLNALRPIVRRDVGGDVAPLQEYLYVFQKLGREEELEQAYVQSRPDRVKTHWEDYSQNTNFSKWLAGYLGRVARLAAEEEGPTGTLFGPKAPRVLCDVVVEAMSPLGGGLAGRLATRSPESCFESYCVAEEFAHKVLSPITLALGAGSSSSSSIGQTQGAQRAALGVLFGGFAAHLPPYVAAETELVGAHFRQLLGEVVFFKAKAGSVGVGSMDDELFGEQEDAADAYALFGDRLLTAADAFQLPLEQGLRRACRYVGGVQVKQATRGMAAVLVLFVRHLAAKVDDLTVASGFPRDAALALPGGGLFSTGAGGAGEDGAAGTGGAGNLVGARALQAQMAVADRLSQQLEVSDVDSRLLITSALRALQAIGRVSRNFAALEVTAKGLLLDLQGSLFPSSSMGTASAPPSSPASVGCQYALQLLRADDAAPEAELRGFLLACTSSQHLSQSPLASAAPSLAKLRAAGSLLLFNLCTEAPAKMLSGLSAEDAWDSGVAGGTLADREALRETMLPQSVVTQVGEHLLSLVQELEAFAASDALPDLLRLRGDAQDLPASSSGWQALRKQLGVEDAAELEAICSRVKCVPLIATIETTLLGSSAAALALASYGEGEGVEGRPEVGQEEGEGVEASDEPDAAAVLGFVNEWLACISDATVGLVLAQVAAVGVFSVAGCAQLLTDLEYLSNVANALGLQPHPFLAHVLALLNREPSALLRSIDLLPENSKGAIGHILRFDHGLIHALAKGHGLL